MFASSSSYASFFAHRAKLLSLHTVESDTHAAASSLVLSEGDAHHKRYDEHLEDGYAHTSLLTGLSAKVSLTYFLLKTFLIP